MALYSSNSGRGTLTVKNPQMSGLTGRFATTTRDLGYPTALQRKLAVQSLTPSAPADSISQNSSLSPASTTPTTQTSTAQATTPTTTAPTNRYGALGGSGSGVGPTASETRAGAMGNRVGVNVGTSQAAPSVPGVQRASLDFDNPAVMAATKGATKNLADLAVQGRKIGASWPAIAQAAPVPAVLGAVLGVFGNKVDQWGGEALGQSRDAAARASLSRAENALNSAPSMDAARRAVEARNALTRAQFAGEFDKSFTNQVLGLGVDAAKDVFGLNQPLSTTNENEQALGLGDLETERTASNQTSAALGLSRDPYGDEHLGTAYAGQDAADIGSAFSTANQVDTSPAAEISSPEAVKDRDWAISQLSSVYSSEGMIPETEIQSLLGNNNYSSGSAGLGGATAQDYHIDRALGLGGVHSLSPAIRANFYSKYGATVGGGSSKGGYSNSRGGRDGTAR